MGRISFNVDAIDVVDLLREIDKIDVPRRDVRRALEAGAEVLAAEAPRHVNERTGELKDSIRVGRRKKSGADAVEVGVFYPDAPYAHLVERGHGGEKAAPAHPFMGAAVEAKGDAAMKAVTEALRRLLE